MSHIWHKPAFRIQPMLVKANSIASGARNIRHSSCNIFRGVFGMRVLLSKYSGSRLLNTNAFFMFSSNKRRVFSLAYPFYLRCHNTQRPEVVRNGYPLFRLPFNVIFPIVHMLALNNHFSPNLCTNHDFHNL
jgi:hypothetical protein